MHFSCIGKYSNLSCGIVKILIVKQKGILVIPKDFGANIIEPIRLLVRPRPKPTRQPDWFNLFVPKTFRYNRNFYVHIVKLGRF